MIIFITGFMMSGKSQIGSELAGELNIPFIDLDEALVQKKEISIKEVILNQGESEFRRLEFEVLKDLVKNAENDLLIALGGGTMCSKHVSQFVLENGVVVYLNRPESYFTDKVDDLIRTRPLFYDLEREKAVSKIQELMKQRRPFYEKSQLQTLVNSGFSPKKLANSLKLLTNRPQSL
ncbi:MAG: hypothetical protein JXR19_04750 [Bacteroidia bacterium]